MDITKDNQSQISLAEVKPCTQPSASLYWPEEKTIHELFERQARETPNDIAVLFQDESLTYHALNLRANTLARRIRSETNVIPDTLIAICLDRSIEMIVAILATMKAGGAYIPIDPRYPKERIQYIIDNANARLILSKTHLIDKLSQINNSSCVAIEPAYQQGFPSNNLSHVNSPNDLAYVIYTSGTTGKPKGVAITHNASINRLLWQKHHYNFNSNDRVLQKTPFVFDVSVWELLLPLLSGGRLVFAKPEGHKDPNYLQQVIEAHQISKLHFVPSMLAVFLDYIEYHKIPRLSNLEHVFCSGENLPISLAKRFKHSFPLIKLHNLYGPTEATIDVCSNDDIQESDDVVHIGKPIANIQFYVLSPKLVPIKKGDIGELYISGIGLARGYINQPKLTEKSFIRNSFINKNKTSNNHSVLYKTGDLVRYLADGNLEYIGRNDSQIKLHGYRIELSEIETILLSVANVKQACVLVKTINDYKQLIGYITLFEHVNFNENKMLDVLAEQLPDYMLPNKLICLQKFPLTENGKLDRDALPEPSNLTSETTFVAPHSGLQKKLSALWETLLQVKKVSVNDNFFHLGGNSLLAIRLVGLVNLKLNCNITVKDIYTTKTIASLANLITQSQFGYRYKDYLITKGFVNKHDAFNLTNAQQAYLYGRLDNFELGNTSAHVYFELNFNRFSCERFEQALNILLQRHSALRTIFADGSQRTLSRVPYYKLAQHGIINDKKLLSIRQRLSHKIYNTTHWPLFDYELSRYNNQFILHVSYDVLIMDGASAVIFFDELSKLYNANEINNVNLPILSVGFRDYMLAYDRVRASKHFEKAKQYWLQNLNHYDFDVNLPMHCKASQIKKPRFARLTQTLEKEKWQRIEEKAKHYSISTTSVVLYAYGQILLKWSGQNNFCINLTLFNRLQLHEQINHLVGDFTVLELFNFKRDVNESIKQAISNVHDELWDDIEHNLFDGIDLQRLLRDSLAIKQTQSLSPIVLTSLLGNPNTHFSFDGYQDMGYGITQTSQVYLDNKAYQTPDGLIAEWDYLEQLFEPDIIKKMHQDYCVMLNNLAEADWQSLPLVPGLSRHDQNVIDQANSEAFQLPASTLFDLFNASANSKPNNVAIIDSHGSYAYHEIAHYSHNLASYLYQHGKQKNHGLIGILSEKGYQQAVAALGIMRIGSTYLPLGYDWPLARIKTILEESGVQTIFVSRRALQRLAKNTEIHKQYQWLIIEDAIVNASSHLALPSPPNSSDIAYVIFTSGSTGKPKGVTISHCSAVNTILAVNTKLNIGEQDRILALSELNFDLSVYDIFGLLAAGGAIVFPTQERTKEPAHWAKLVTQNNITLWNSVPQLMQLLVDTMTHSSIYANLRAILLSGDWIPLQLPQQIKSRNTGITIFSLGGATEGSIWSIWYEVKNINGHWSSIPYGKAMPNQKMYVLNTFGEHCPCDVLGEIYIGGVGVAEGYWQDEERTQASFINHNTLGKLYKTGDLGKWHKDGYIVFQGRKDHQVKINGYRVELEEIAYQLQRLPGIEKALARYLNNRLIAYIIKTSNKPSESSLNKKSFILAQHGVRNDLTPHYQIPVTLNEKAYRSRKSYRQFKPQALTSLPLTPAPQITQAQIAPKFALSIDELAKLLSPLCSIKLLDKALPKYRYPSSGHSYAIQSYLSIPANQILGIESGYYYFHPITHQLHRLDATTATTALQIQFKLYLPAIEPLYDKESLRLAYLEIGHILYCLDQAFATMKISYAIKIDDEASHPYINLLTLTLNKSGETLVEPPLESTFLLNDKGHYSAEQKTYNLNQQSIFLQISEQGQLLANAKGMLVFTGENNPLAFIKAGFEAQHLAEQWLKHGIGSCPIGYVPIDSVIYSLVVGYIDDTVLAQAVSQTSAIKLNHYLSNQLSLDLPTHMVPNCYMQLHELPLTANSKINYNALPLPKLADETKYIAPSTKLEKTIAIIWQKLLNCKKISIIDNFFQLGGNSILTIKAAHLLSEALNKQISVPLLFQNNTIKALAVALSTLEENVFIPPTTQTIAPLSFAQQRLLFIEKFSGGTSAYHVPLCFKLGPNSDIERLKYALQVTINRHEVLRTIYRYDSQGKNYQQVITQTLPIKNIKIDVARLEDMLAEDLQQTFNLEEMLPIRATVYQTTSNYYFLITIHHIAFDGWSIAIFIEELTHCYLSLCSNKQTNLQPLQIQYKDFSVWQRQYLQDKGLASHLSYWKQTLANAKPLLFPYDFPRPAQIDHRGDSIKLQFSEHTSLRLRKTASKLNISLYTLLLSGFFCLLYKYTGQKDIAIGTPIANRHYPQVKDLIGLFANTLVIRESIDPLMTMSEFIQNLKQTLSAAQTHQDVPFEVLVDALNLERDQSQHPLFQVSFRVQSFIPKTSFNLCDVDFLLKASPFDFDILIDDSNSTLCGKLTYATSLFKKETIQQLSNHYQYLLRQLTEAINQKICDYQSLLPEEQQKLVYEWNLTDKDYPAQKNYVQIFEDQVSKTPEKIALCHQGTKLSYSQLNAEANRLAHHLQTHLKVRQNTLIILYFDRSIEMVISLLAIMKAGAAYVPVGTNYPLARIQYIVDDTDTQAILTTQPLKTQLQGISNVKIIPVNRDHIHKYPTKNLGIYTPTLNLAYVIYTSGTTGTPKGVMISHQSLNNYIHCAKTYLKQIERIDFSSELSFDLSVTTTLLPLATGKCLFIYSGNLSDTSRYLEHLNKHKIQFIKSTPSFLQQLPFAKLLHKLDICFIGGEKSELSFIRAIKQFIHRVYDEYGPTETTVGATLFECDEHTHNIGKPYPNYKLYVLDTHKKPTPLGVVGELYIAGAGLAMGYLNQPRLTEEKFISNPFATPSDINKGYTRLYRTGDLVKRLANGNLTYIGRIDSQVKLYGHRIELGEIENNLLENPLVKQACVLLKTSRQRNFLVAYIVTCGNEKLSDEKILDDLSERMPGYMLPTHIIHLSHFPLTTNGKLDTQTLPEPHITRSKQFIAPISGLEKQLCQIWQKTLGIAEVGLGDDFFFLGGNSILAMQITARMSELLKCQVKVAHLFKYKNIANIIAKLESIKTEANTCVTLLSKHIANDKPAIFLVHGVGGNIMSYYKLVNSLEKGYSVFGIQAQGFDDDISFFSSYQEMVEKYVSEIKQIFINYDLKEYNIVSWSYGVGVALEIISSLPKHYRCNQAFLIDGSPCWVELPKLKEFSTSEPMAPKNLQLLIDFYTETFHLEAKINSQDYNELICYLHELFGYSINATSPKKVENRVAVALHNIKNLLASQTHVPKQYAADTFHIINAKTSQPQYRNWDTILTSNNLKCFEVASNHWSMLTAPELLAYFN